MLHSLQRVEEELQGSAGLVAPPIPPRAAPTSSATTTATADDDDDDDDDDNDDSVNDGSEDDNHYLELKDDEDVYEISDVVGSMRRHHVLPGQKSMPEAALPLAVMPRKQSCPDTAATMTTRHRPPRPLPTQTRTDPGKPTDSVTLKPTDKPAVAARKK